MKLHETQRVVTTDKYFVCGGDPDGRGGGVIGTCNTLIDAHALQLEAIKANYSRVRVWTYNELHRLTEED